MSAFQYDPDGMLLGYSALGVMSAFTYTMRGELANEGNGAPATSVYAPALSDAFISFAMKYLKLTANGNARGNQSGGLSDENFRRLAGDVSRKGGGGGRLTHLQKTQDGLQSLKNELQDDEDVQGPGGVVLRNAIRGAYGKAVSQARAAGVSDSELLGGAQGGALPEDLGPAETVDPAPVVEVGPGIDADPVPVDPFLVP